ncbi:MAG: hypothetical protein AAFX87_18295 [Bacteroidota bacterium]
MHKKLLFLTLCTTLFVTDSLAQTSNSRCKWVKDFDRNLLIDSLSVVPGSIKIEAVDGVSVSFEYFINSGEIIVHPSSSLDSVQVCYKVFPYAFHKEYYNRSLDQYDSNAVFKDLRLKDKQVLLQQRDELFTTEDLSKSGSISRGISFGNTQSAVVNSTLNLNLDGKLTDDLNIRAAITDQNIPFEPEGNTQQLQELDNVFIQLYNDNFSLTGGDVVLQNKESYFLKYYKNVQGGKAEVKYNVGDSSEAVTSLGISVAKGRFASIFLDVEEGVLGPYQIPGPNGENFIIILANSERVFLDGKRLTRGFNHDYVIDYNQGEITFTNNILVTQFSRIRIDYEFSDQNYSRTITAASHYQNAGKVDFFLNAYSERDNPNRPLLFDLTNDQRQLLSEVGDATDLAVIPSVDSIAFDPNLVLYERVDTVDLDGRSQSIFVFSADPEAASFNLTFSNVGQGNGNYIQANSIANGRVFEWVSPIDGVPQGSFEPVVALPPPNEKRMFNFGVAYQATEYDRFFGELALTNQDVNLLSPIDDENNDGAAFKIGYESRNRPIDLLKGYKLSAFADVELDNEDFVPIDRFRYIEFDRDWSFDPTIQTERFSDNIINVGLGLTKDSNHKLNYKLVRRKRGDQIDGYQHYANIAHDFGKLRWRTDLFVLRNDQSTLRSDWARYNSDISFQNKTLIPGYIYRLDRNEVFVSASDSVISTAMNFEEHLFYIKSAPKNKTQLELNYSLREDRLPFEGELRDNNQARTANLIVRKASDNGGQLNVIFTYRNLENLNTPDNPNDETVSGRVDWVANLLDRHIKTELNYSVSNSREIRREFVFIRVPAGEGTHTWRDQNENGVQELNEFFLAINPDERNFAKIFVPTSTFISAFDNIFNFRINILAPRKWRSADGLKKLISKFSNNTSWTANNKITDDNLSSRFLSFVKQLPDADVLSTRGAVRSTLFFNRGNPKYGFDLSYQNTQRKQLLTNGFETIENEEFNFNTRLNIGRLYNFRLQTQKGMRVASSDFLTGRNFAIDNYRVQPELSWQPKRNLRLTGKYAYTDKRNNLSAEATENAIYNEIITELRATKASSYTLSATFRIINIAFEGEENTPLGYELLNGLRPGQNATWGINFQQKLASGLQISLSYDGRKSEQSEVVHLGRMQVSALF